METGHPTVNFNNSITEVVKNMKYSMTKETKAQLNAFLNGLASVIIEKAIFLSQNSFGQTKKPGKTLSSREIQAATKLVVPTEFAQFLVEHGTGAVTKYVSSQKKGRTTRTKKAGGSHSVSRVETLIRTYWSGRLSELSSVYLAGVLDFMTNELIDMAGRNAKKNKRQRITLKDMREIISDDPELRKIMSVTGWSFLG